MASPSISLENILLKIKWVSDVAKWKSFWNSFLLGFSITDTDDLQNSRGREGTIFYSTLSLPPAHEHWDIYFQLCMWDDYHVFLIATLVFTRLLLDEISSLIKLALDWLIDWLIDDAMFVCVFDELILGFCYSGLTWETGGFELVSTITRVLQANRLSKCASHPNYPRKDQIYLMQVYMFRSNHQIKFENPKS